MLKKAHLTGRVEQVLRSPNRDWGLEKEPVSRLTATFAGIKGDCHCGLQRLSDVRMRAQYPRATPVANSRQLSLVSLEELADIAAALDIPELPAGWLGANVVTSAIPRLTWLPPATRLMFSSGATVVVDLENGPCRHVGDVIERHHPGKGGGFVTAATGRRGVVGWVEREGAIEPGDEITLFMPPARIYPPSR